jgi:hypothetical protein
MHRIDSIAQLSAISVELTRDIPPGSGRMASFKADLAVYLAYLEEVGRTWKVARIYFAGLRGAREKIGEEDRLAEE